MQLSNHINTKKKNLVQKRKIVKAKPKAWKAYFCKKKLKIVKNLSIFSLKFIFLSKLCWKKLDRVFIAVLLCFCQ